MSAEQLLDDVPLFRVIEYPGVPPVQETATVLDMPLSILLGDGETETPESEGLTTRTAGAEVEVCI
jgi:hypothetical protein